LRAPVRSNARPNRKLNIRHLPKNRIPERFDQDFVNPLPIAFAFAPQATGFESSGCDSLHFPWLSAAIWKQRRDFRDRRRARGARRRRSGEGGARFLFRARRRSWYGFFIEV
jgi:hypothetical protein